MANTTIYSAAGDGIVRNASTSSWSTVRGASTGTVVDSTTSPQVAVQAAASNVYGDSKNYVDRAFFAFDTSSIPDDATIFSASIGFYVETKTTTAGGSIVLTSGTQASTSTLATSDFGSVGTTEYGTARPTFSGISTSAYNSIGLNASGIAAISKTGYTKLALLSSFDFDNSAPTANQRSAIDSLRFSEYAGTGSDPYLYIEYGYEKTFTADAIITGSTETTVTADAIVVSRGTQTATADAVVSRISLAADSFLETGGSAVNLTSHTPSGPAAAGTWSSHPASGLPSAVAASSGRYAYPPTAAGTSLDLNSTTPSSADYDVEATVTVMATAHSCGVLARWDTSATTGYTAFIDGGGVTAAGYLRLYKQVAGVATELGTAYNIGTLTGPYRLRLRCVGSTISAWLDGTQRISVTDTSITSVGKAGLRITGTSSTSSFRLASWGLFEDGTRTTTFTADAVVQGSVEKTFTADALVGNPITADGVTQGTSVPDTVVAASGASDSLNYNAFPGLAQASNGNMVMALHHANNHVGDGTNKLNVYIGTRIDLSGTYNYSWVWGSANTLRTTTGTSGATPGNIADAGVVRLADGTLMVTWNESTTPGHANVNTVVRFQTMWSADNGVSWGTNSPSYNNGSIQTSAVPGWATSVSAGSGGGAYAVAPCKPVQLANGDLLLATYGWDNRAIEDGGGSFNSHEYVKCMKSTDSGVTWTQVGTIFPDTAGSAYDETDLLLLDTGVVLAACRKITGSGTGYNIVVSRSYDSGVTWSSESIALGTSSTTGWGGRPDLVQTPNGGVLLRTRYMVAGTSGYTGYRLSLDRGATWQSGVDPYDGAAERTTATPWPASSTRGTDVYGAFAKIGSSNQVGYAWSEELNSTGAVTYFRVLSVYDQTTKTFTADAVVGTRNTQTFTADAVVTSSFTTQSTRTFTADGVIQQQGLTKTFTADAIVSETVVGLQTFTKTFSADALVDSSPGASFSGGLFFYSVVGQDLEFWGQD